MPVQPSETGLPPRCEICGARYGPGSENCPGSDCAPRLRLQVRRLQPDHFDRARAAGQSHHQPHRYAADAEVAHQEDPAQYLPATAALIARTAPARGMAALELAFPVRKTPRLRPAGFFLAMPHVRASAKLLIKKRQGHVREVSLTNCATRSTRASVLSGGDIDARYHHDPAGNPAPKPRAVVRPRTTEDVSALAAALSPRRCPRYDAGRHDRAGARRACRMRTKSCCRWSA